MPRNNEVYGSSYLEHHLIYFLTCLFLSPNLGVGFGAGGGGGWGGIAPFKNPTAPSFSVPYQTIFFVPLWGKHSISLSSQMLS